MSFNFERNNSRNSSNSSTRSTGMQNCRRKLQETFEESGTSTKNSDDSQKEGEILRERTVLSVLSLNDTRKVFRNGAEKITKTFNTVRITFGTLAQRFKASTRRRQILQEGPMTPNNCQTPHTISKQILGRTPTKLYSPFSIESPYSRPMTYTTCDKENIPIQRHLVKKTGE